MSRRRRNTQHVTAMSRGEIAEMVRILDKKDYDGRKQVYKQPRDRKNEILDRVISSLEQKFGVQRTKPQLQRRWSDLKYKEDFVLESLRTEIRERKKKDRKKRRRNRERQRELEEEVEHDEDQNAAAQAPGDDNTTVMKVEDNGGDDEVAVDQDEAEPDMLGKDAEADVSQQDQQEVRDQKESDINTDREEHEAEEISGTSYHTQARETITIDKRQAQALRDNFEDAYDNIVVLKCNTWAAMSKYQEDLKHLKQKMKNIFQL
ncbi:uncharacterized protein [Hyperolius riggenbachi]|uniref:uncharacterized protein n=1 Tax=Hyperolius riggenbachi TaxID=752182 RepID=UPI0035A3192F